MNPPPPAQPVSPSTRHGSALADWALLLVCNCTWAGQFALVKLVQREVGPVFATSFPMLVATVLLVPAVWGHLRSGRRFGARDVGLLWLLGVCGQVVAQLFVTWGLRHSLASNAALMTLALPVITAVFAFLWLGERMNRLRWLAFALALSGVVLCSAQELSGMDMGQDYLWGNLLIFLSISGSAFYNVLSKKLLGTYSALEVLFGSYVAAAIVLQPLTLWLEPGSFGRLFTLSGRAWVGLGLLALFQYFLSMVLFLRVLTRLHATQAALSNYMIPVFGLLMAWWLLDERLTPLMLAGGVLVLGGTLITTVLETRGERTRARASAMRPDLGTAPGVTPTTEAT